MNEWDAVRGAAALKATGRNRNAPEQGKLWEDVRASKVAKDEEYGKTGNTAEAMAKEGVKIIKATYDFAIHTHGSIGPSCAMAEFKDGTLTSWSASQATHDLRNSWRQMFALPVESSAASISRAPAATAATATKTRPPTPRCLPRPPASRCACNGRAPTSTAGTRRVRRR